MSADPPSAEAGSFVASFYQFSRDFISYCGRQGIVAAISVALGAVFEGLSLVLIIPLLGVVIGTGLPTGKLGRTAGALFHFVGVERPFGQLALLLGIFALLMIVRAFVIYFRDVSVSQLQTSFTEARRLHLAERLAAAQWHQIVGLRHARITHVINGDVQRIAMIAQLAMTCVVAGAMLIGQSVLVFLLTPVLAVAAFGLLVIGSAASVPVIGRARILGGFLSNAHMALLNTTTQFLGGLKLAVSQNLQGRFIDEFRQTLQELTRRQIEFVRIRSRSRMALSTLSALAGGIVVLIGFGAFNVDAPTLITLLVIMTRMTGPVGQIQQSLQQLANVLPAYENVRALESELATIPQEPVEQTAAPLAEGPIVFDRVSFRHTAESDDDALRGIEDVSLTIEPRTFIGIAGPSGAGKTTFADLLVGLFPPQQGRITVAGAPLSGAILSAWREQVSYVSQDPYLFHDTVRRNLAWANPQASDGDMWQALTLAGADDLVRRMELGLDTVVGDRGTLVSGGERQRIALARAILRKPRMLILDEATSAIDVASEREILARLRALAPRPTIVVIAHRAESLALCDHVFQLAAGRHVDDAANRRGKDRLMTPVIS